MLDCDIPKKGISIKRKMFKPSVVAENKEYATQLWEESEAIVKSFKFK